MGSHQTGAPVPGSARDLPVDASNTAPATLSRYGYQAKCIALHLLRHLGSDDLLGVLIEHSTDVILVKAADPPELVSIKHREPHQTHSAEWTWSALKQSRVLLDLYAAWLAADKKATVAFWSNAGFSGPAYLLWEACSGARPAARPEALAGLAKHLAVSRAAAEEFMAVLKLPREVLARRNEIDAVGVETMSGVLEMLGRSPALAKACWSALLQQHVEPASKDPAESPAFRAAGIGATLRDCLERREEMELAHRYLAADAMRDFLAQHADQLDRHMPGGQRFHGLEADPLFVGRDEHLAQLARLLRPGDVGPVTPVVIHGMTGCGKTSLAAQFAALNAMSFTTYAIDASSRASLLAGLQVLGGLDGLDPSAPIMANLRGPVTARLPGNSATLLILDGVTDADIVDGLIPRSSLCRVIITSVAEHLDEGYARVELPSWSREESVQYIQRALGIEDTEASAAQLADALADHPLAVCQAVNYCATAGIQIPEYLQRWRSAPASVLSHGRASGHPAGIVQTVQLAITAITERDPVAAGLLTVLAHLGAAPVPLELFAAEPIAAYVAVLPNGRRRRSLRKSDAEDERFLHGPEWQVREALFDDVQRDRAVAGLRSFSLAGVVGGQIRCHPLVQHLVRAGTTDPQPWLRVSLGLFAGQLSGPKTAWYTLDEHLSHLDAILTLATKHGLEGPALTYTTCCLMARLSEYGDEPTAIALGRSLYKRLMDRSDHWTTGNELVEVSSALLRPLLLAGRAQEAIDLAHQNLALAQNLRGSGSREASLRPALELGDVVWNINRHELARPVLALLPDPRSIDTDTVSLRLGLANVKAKLLALCNQLDEAKEIIDWAIQHADSLPSDESTLNMRFVLAGTATDIYRDLGDSAASAAFIRESLAQQDAVGGKRIGRERGYIQTLLTVADAATETGQLERARELLAEAEALLIGPFGPGTVTHASFLAIRARLELTLRFVHHATPDDVSTARADLEEAVRILRSDSNAIRVQLPSALVHLAQAYFADGDLELAFEAANEALSIDMEQYGPDHPQTATDLHLISQMQAFASLMGR